MNNMQALHYAQFDDPIDGRAGASAGSEAHHADSKIRTDMHLGVYVVLLSCWAAFFSIFWMTFFAHSQAMFLIGFCTIFAVVAFGLPIVMNRTGGYLPASPGSLGDFLRGRVATIDGSVSGMEALVQVILVPACLCVGGIAIGLIITASRFSY